MQLESHLTHVHDQLTAAAALGDERTREIADGLATAATPAVRLALLAAVSAAADEITAALLDYPGAPAVAVRLDGDEIAVDVRATATAGEAEPAADAGATRPEDGDATARISLRLSETLKSEIDAAAEREGVSVNTWLVRAAAGALRGGQWPFGMPGGPMPFGGPAEWRRAARHGGSGESHRITGWISG